MPKKPIAATSAPDPDDDRQGESPVPNAGAKPKRILRDARDASDTEVPQSALPLEVVRLDANSQLLSPFTSKYVNVDTHFLKVADLGFIHCNGADCVLCLLELKLDRRRLVPMYDLVATRVSVLAVSNYLRPGALWPQLHPVLRDVGDGGPRQIVSIRKPDRVTFALEVLPLPEGVDDGAPIIADFLRRLEAGEVDLAAVYPTVADEDLRRIPEIALQLKLRGLA